MPASTKGTQHCAKLTYTIRQRSLCGRLCTALQFRRYRNTSFPVDGHCLLASACLVTFRCCRLLPTAAIYPRPLLLLQSSVAVSMLLVTGFLLTLFCPEESTYIQTPSKWNDDGQNQDAWSGFQYYPLTLVHYFHFIEFIVTLFPGFFLKIWFSFLKMNGSFLWRLFF